METSKGLNALSKFTAKIEMKDRTPVVMWSPDLNGDGVREGERTYRVWGKANLDCRDSPP